MTAPPSPTPPRSPSLRAPLLTASIVLFPAAAYALWPLSVPKLPAGTPSTSPAVRTPISPASLNLAAFRAPLWVAPIPPPSPPAPPPPPPPLKLQLIAIACDSAGTVLSATLFDPDAGKLLTLTQGQSIGSRTLTRITPTTIDIRDAAGTRTLSLRAETSSGGAP